MYSINGMFFLLSLDFFKKGKFFIFFPKGEARVNQKRIDFLFAVFLFKKCDIFFLFFKKQKIEKHTHSSVFRENKRVTRIFAVLRRNWK